MAEDITLLLLETSPLLAVNLLLLESLLTSLQKYRLPTTDRSLQGLPSIQNLNASAYVGGLL